MENANREIPNIPRFPKKRIVIAGSGFAGLKLARKLMGKGFQIILIDKNNFHQFQPLLYQVATAGLEPSAISFPLRKVLQKATDVHFRIAELVKVDASKNEVITNIGRIKYDYLVLAMGAKTNFFGQHEIEHFALSMKSASDAILIRNSILEHFEQALLETDPKKIEQYLNIILVGGGPTGVELAGALAEMRKYIFPKDYPELDLSKMRIAIYEAAPRVLAGMSEQASERALSYLQKLGVEVHLRTRVEHYNGSCIRLSNGSTISSKTVIWSAGVKANSVEGFTPENFGRGGRIIVDRQNRVKGHKNVFALGDISQMETPKYPHGHPQVAQVALQQGRTLARNLLKSKKGKGEEDFEYFDKGSLATIGRNLAVADLPYGKLHGFVAWVLWSFVHLFTIMGVKNRLLIFLNWSWNYFTYDQSLRLLIKPKMAANIPKTLKVEKTFVPHVVQNN
ncbi:MAG: NAD(P)/FAD-dependent oxidoreductase [Bacteroidales bacterium]